MGRFPLSAVDVASPTKSRAVPAIEVRDLRVDYGDFVAVDDLALSVPAGEVFGLVGPNGAGKTSTFRVLTTLMEPTYGEVFLDGIDAFEDIEEVRRIVGYMPDLAPVPSDLKVWEFLDFHAAAYGLGFSGIVPAYVMAIRDLFPSREASWRVPVVLFVSMGGMAVGTWWAGALFDHFGYYGPAFMSGVLFNLANLAVVGFLVLRQRREGALRRPAFA